MIKKHLTIVLIVILAVANAVTGSLLISAYYGRYAYDENAVSELIGLMDGIGVEVPAGIFSSRRGDVNVYSGECTDDMIIRAANVIAPDGIVSRNGNEISVLTQQGHYTFGQKSEFDYKANSVFGIDEEKFDTRHDDAILTRSLLRTVRKYFHLQALFSSGVNSGGAADTSTSIVSVASDSSGNYLVELCVTFDGLPTDNTVQVVISGGDVVYAHGKLPFVLPTVAQSADIYDRLTVVTQEYRRLSGKVTEKKTMTGITVGYDMSIDAFGTVYYMPICTVSYSDGEIAVYDLIQCKLL